MQSAYSRYVHDETRRVRLPIEDTCKHVSMTFLYLLKSSVDPFVTRTMFVSKIDTSFDKIYHILAREGYTTRKGMFSGRSENVLSSNHN